MHKKPKNLTKCQNFFKNHKILRKKSKIYPVHPVSESMGGTLSVTLKQRKDRSP